MAVNSFGIDLGTYNIKIYNGFKDEITLYKNIIAIQNRRNLFAYGADAFTMFEKAPDNIEVSFPLKYGVIADINHMQILLRNFINDEFDGNIRPANYYISVPTDITEVEKRAFVDLVKESNIRAKNIYIVEKASADGIGMNIDASKFEGVLVVNVGFETTEISILSMGGIVISKLIKVGGRKFDEAIRTMVRKEYNLMIGAKTAEIVKIELPDLIANGRDAILYGRDIVTGLPVERSVPTVLISKAMSEHFGMIIDTVRQLLERTPPELGADIYRNGIFLTGGSCAIGDLHTLIAQTTGLKVLFSQNKEASVAYGLSQIIKNDALHSLVYSIEDFSVYR